MTNSPSAGPKRRIGVVVVDRANYGRLKPLMLELKAHPQIELVTIVAGTMLLDRFGKAVSILEADGFEIDARVFMELEGSQPETMTKSIALGINEFSFLLGRMALDLLVVIGDRYEALSAVIAAAYMNVTIVHLQGGEVSGSIDESARHAMTKFAHYHFPATKRASDYIIRMGENPDRVFGYGCPVADVIARTPASLPREVFNAGVGADIDSSKPFLMVVFHPITTEFGVETESAAEILECLHERQLQTVWLWPNIDAGADKISRLLRQYREKHSDTWLRLFKNFTPEIFQAVLANAACAIGNSSSFVRDSTFTGTPVVLVGNRQFGRETCKNALSVPCNRREIERALDTQLRHGRYPVSNLYGTPGVSRRIAATIADLPLIRQKHLHYILD